MRIARRSSLLAFGLSLVCTFTTASAVDFDSKSHLAVPGDFNGDGRMDVLMQPLEAGGKGAILLRDGTGQLSVTAQGWDPGYLGLDWSAKATTLTAADFNGDGQDDVLVQPVKAGGTAAVLITDPTVQLLQISQLLPSGYLNFDWSSETHHAVAGDFDGDRRKELFMQATQPGGLGVVVHADETGHFVAVTQTFVDGYLGRRWNSQDEKLYVGDFNGDGRQDLLVQSRGVVPGESAFALLLADGNGQFTSIAETWNLKDLGANWNPSTHKIIIEDANHDGIMDIVLQSTVSGGTSYVFEGNAQGLFTQPAAHWTGDKSASDVLNTKQSGSKTHGTGISIIPGGGGPSAKIITAPTNPEQNPTIPRGTQGAQGSGQIMTANAAGVLQGSGGVSGGTATYSVPIAVPPGIAGMQPSISLNYSSRGGNGEMGMGWSLSAGSQIHRCPATVAMDTYSTGVTYSINDRLCLDGQHLIKVSGNYGTNGATYRTELDAFSIVTESGAISSSGSTFTVHTKNGHTLTYGGAGGSTFTPSGAPAPLAWGVAVDLDTYQNSIMYTYSTFAPGEYLLTAIKYTGTATVAGNREVDFSYSTRSDISTQYLAGGLTTQSQILSSVATWANGVPVRTYSMDYSGSATTARTLLAGVQECAGVGSNRSCLPETTFSWHNTPTSFNAPISYDISSFDPEADNTLTAYSPGNLHQPYITSPGDFNGDGRKELIYSRPTFGTYLLFLDAQGNVSTFSNLGALQDLSQPLNSTGVYYADIDGDGATDVVGPVLNGSQYLLEYSNYTGSSSNQGFSPPITTSLVIPTININGTNQPGILAVTDVDGDGRPDVIMYTLDGSGNMIVEVAINNTSPGGAVSFKAPVSMGVTLASGSAITPIASLDGSGFQDFQVTEFALYEDGSQITSGMQILGWIFTSRDTADKTKLDFQYETYSSLGVDNQAVDMRNNGMMMDINGDGLPDYVFTCFTTTTDWCYQLNTGAVGSGMFSKTVDTLQADPRSLSAVAGSTQVDVHNDGRQELIYPDVMLSNYCIYEVESEGGAGGQSENGSEEECAIGGYDGKGLPSNDDFSVYRYSSIEFLPTPDSNQPSGYRYVPTKSATNIVGQSHQAVAIDLQGDGLNTIVSAFSKWFATGHFDPVAQFPNYVKPHGVAVAYNSDTTVGGSGMSLNSAPDLMLTATDGFNHVEQWDYYPLSSDVQFNTVPLYYAPTVGAPNRYAGAGSFYFASSMYVVGDYKDSSGVGPLNEHDFHYAQAIYDGTGRGFQGFRTVVDDDMVSGARTVQIYHQRFPLSGLLQESWTAPQTSVFDLTNPVADNTAVEHTTVKVGCYYGAGANTLASGTYTVDPVNDKITCTSLLDAPTFMPYVSEEKEHKQDTAGNRLSDTTTDYTYDEYGNLTDAHTTVMDDQGTYTKDAQTEFYAADTSTTDSTPWWLDKLENKITTVQATYGSATPPPVTRETDYLNSYDSGRMPTQVNGFVGDSNFATLTTYAYTLGNVTSVTVAPVTSDPNTPPRTTTTTYSTGGDANYFVASVKDPLNHITTMTADPRFGSPLTVTDPNSMTTTYIYDSFGRKTSVQVGSLPAQTTAYITSVSGDGMCDGMLGLAVSQYYVLVSQPGYPDHYTCYDMFNRGIRSANESLASNSNLVYTDSQYDVRGRVKTVTEPHFAVSTAPVLSNTIAYSSDILGRVTKKVDAKGIETDYGYTGLVTDITTSVSPCPTGAVNCVRDDEEITNSIGKLINVTNAKGQVDPVTQAPMQATTAYVYDSDGNPITITAADNSVIQAQYNILGLKKSVADPDQGATGYTYDAFGDLRIQTDAKGQTLTMYYDKEGRMTSKTSTVSGEPTVTWTYDSFVGCSNGVHKLCDVSVSDGTYEETYNYNGNGLIKTDIESISGVPYETDTTYDSDGRVNTVAYPDSIPDQPPVANAGTTQYVVPNASVSLNGSGSSDPDGGPQSLDYQWTQTSGPSVTLSGNTSANPSFTAGSNGTSYTFQLMVDDGLATGSASVSVTVPALPAAPAGLTDDGDTDHDGNYVVAWNTVSVPGTSIIYHLEEATGTSSGPTGTWTETYAGGTANTSISHTGNGSYYYWYRVRAEGQISGTSIGYGSYSSTDDIHVVVTPGVPSSISPTTGSSTTGTYSISWGAYTGSVKSADVFYELQESSTTGFTSVTTVYSGTARSDSISKTSLGDWYYRVRACNQDGSLKECSAWVARAHEIVTGTGGGGGQQQVIHAPGGATQLAPAPTTGGQIGMIMPASHTTVEAMPEQKLALLMVPSLRRSATGSKMAYSRHVRPIYASPVYQAWANAKLQNATGTTTYARFSVQYVYSSNGYLLQLADAVDPNRVYWQVDQYAWGAGGTDSTGDFIEHGMNAYGQVTNVIFGSNVVTTHYGYDGTTDYLDSITSTKASSTYQSLAYNWEANGDLLSRTSSPTTTNPNNLTETFNYDIHNRLTQTQVTTTPPSQQAVVQTAVTYTYDSIGDVMTKSDVGTYSYGSSAGPHAVTSVAGTVNGSYAYDANGNMTCRSTTGTCSASNPNMAWNSDNLPTSIVQDANNSSTFAYAPDKHRYKQVALMSSGAGNTTETTLYVGGMEQLTTSAGTEYRHTITAYGRPVMLDTLSVTGTVPTEKKHYLLTDHLGSVDTVIDDTGAVMPEESFDAFGNRRDAGSWHGAMAASDLANARAVTHRGFTHHEHLDNLGLVHMNGRLEDPVIGRMLSVDPVFQAPSNSQSVNPYSYVMNNPLSLTDPSGYEAACSDGGATACPNNLAHGSNKQEGDHNEHAGSHIAGHLDGFESCQGHCTVTISGNGGDKKQGTTEPSTKNQGGSADQLSESQKPNVTNVGDKHLTGPCEDPSDCGGPGNNSNDNSNTNNNDPQFVDPTGKGERGRDAAGNGDYQAPRTSASGKHYGHQGEDYLADPGQKVVADISGRVTRVIVVYTAADVAKDPKLASFRGVEIVNPETGFSSRLFYVSVSPGVVGTTVHAGDPIGTAQDRAGIAPGMKNHVHVEIRQNGALKDPRIYIHPPN